MIQPQEFPQISALCGFNAAAFDSFLEHFNVHDR